MTESEAVEEPKYDCHELGKAIPCDTSWGCSFENAYGMAIQALENQEKIKEIIANANQWSKEDIVVKAQAYCDIEKILRSDEE